MVYPRFQLARQFKYRVLSGGGDITITSTSKTPIDSTNLAYVTLDCQVGDVIRCRLASSVNVSGGSVGGVDFEVDQPTSANVYIGNTNDLGVARWSSIAQAAVFEGLFVVTEVGSHGFRPVAVRSGGTNIVFNNATSGVGDTLITFTAENLGPPDPN